MVIRYLLAFSYFLNANSYQQTENDMENILPDIYWNHTSFNIQVMNFKQLSILLSQAKDHNPFAAHKIQFYLILIATENSYTHFIDFKSYELKKESALFVTKNQVHCFNKELHKSKGFAIVFNHLFVDKHYFLTDNFRLNRLFNYHIESPVIHQEEMGEDSFVGLFLDLHKEYYSDSNFAKSEILASLLRLLLLKAERAKEFQSTPNINTLWLETFSKFKDLLEIDYSKSRNSKMYASKLFVSYKFLNEVVKKLTGSTVKAFINNFVTIEIKRYLISTSLTVNEISYMTGFEDPANMVKFFKKNADTTPLKFRQQL